MLQNIELIKKTDSTEEVSSLIVKGQRGRSQTRGPKKDPSASSIYACYYCRKLRHIKKIYFKYKEMLRKKAIRILMGLILVESLNKPVIEEADENPCDVRQLNQERKSTQMLSYLT